MGLGTFLWLAMFGASSAKAAWDNLDCKADFETLPNGIKYYIDRRGCFRLVKNDDLIHFQTNGVVKHHKTGKILYDPKADANQKASEHVDSSKGYRYAQQYVDRCDFPATVDLITGRVVAQVQEKVFADGHAEYRKWYLYDVYEEKYGKGNCGGCMKVSPNRVRYGDPGIVITEEEFNAINTCPKIEIQLYHRLLIDEEEDFSFYHYSDIYRKDYDVECNFEREIERGLAWKKKGHGDSWYGTLHDIYVKDGMIAGKKMKDENGEYYTAKPYKRKVGGQFVDYVMSYETYLWCIENDKFNGRNMIHFR